MIIDQLCVFSDNVAPTATPSKAVDLMPFAGKGEPVLVTVAVTKPFAATGTLSIAVQESSDGSTYTAVQTVTAPNDVVRKGGVFHFALPSSLRGTSVRLAYTAANAGTGALFAGVSRDVAEVAERGQMTRGA